MGGMRMPGTHILPPSWLLCPPECKACPLVRRILELFLFSTKEDRGRDSEEIGLGNPADLQPSESAPSSPKPLVIFKSLEFKAERKETI